MNYMYTSSAFIHIYCKHRFLETYRYCNECVNILYSWMALFLGLLIHGMQPNYRLFQNFQSSVYFDYCIAFYIFSKYTNGGSKRCFFI